MAITIKQQAENRRRAFVSQLSQTKKSTRYKGIMNAHDANVQDSIEEIWCYVRENRYSLNAHVALVMIRASIDMAVKKDIDFAIELLAEVDTLQLKLSAARKVNNQLQKSIKENEHGHHGHQRADREAMPN